VSELRYNIISLQWVILATERAKRPKDFIKEKKNKDPIPQYKADCPFCPGNEIQTPGETLRMGDEKAWKVRAVANKFGALSPEQKRSRSVSGLRTSMNGFGRHEVIIEHPSHNAFIALMSDEEAQDIIKAYKSRYVSICSEEGIEDIVIFKNHGPSAGTSLEHPHSQLVATPVVPPQIRQRVEKAAGFFDLTGNCIFCRTLEEELKDKERIILETPHFVSFIPYAALSPFHIWIFPRRHTPSFSEINKEEIADLAINLKQTLGKLYYGLDDPDFNYSIRSMPVNENGKQYYHWYVSIVPRVSQPAGFELGSGMFINSALPETSAQFLREIKA
jgi:UDPglucose--hexose-1-phosphate uridylyltransferase